MESYSQAPFCIFYYYSELFDTFFILIHKKKLIFLHWYHHITVLLYCWHSYVTHTPSGIFFVNMNYGVHSVMYFYYFLMAIKIRPPWAMMVTFLQISQMFVGVAFTILGFIYVGTDNCTISHSNNMAAFLMYGSYLVLFLQFFISRYFVKSSKKKEA
jgi:elongation of very long chain fatty acids protein 6